MSHKWGRASSEKRLDVSKKQSRNTEKKCCSLFTLSTDSKYFNHSRKIDRQRKIKRLKTRKERSQLRGGWKEAEKTKSRHQHCHRQSSKDGAFLQNCCFSCHWTSRSTPILSAVPVAQEPTIITNSRLIGHHGLFNHKVKSIDVERLLSNQSKLELSRQNITEESNNTSNLSSGTHIPALLSSDGLLGVGADANAYDDVRPIRTKTSPVSQETEVQNLQGSDITPGQRPKQQLDPLSGSFKIIPSSKHSLHSEETTTTDAKKDFKSEKKGICQLTPSDGNDSVTTLNGKQNGPKITDLEQPHKNRVQQTRAGGLKPAPLQLFSSPTAESVDMQHKRQDPENVAKVISAVAKHLSGSLPLSVQKPNNLSEKNRKLLLKSLQKSHGPWLQANLLELHQCVGYDTNPTQATLDQEQIMTEEHEVLLPDTCVPTTGSRTFTWESTPQPHQSLQQIADGLSDPAEPAGNFFEEAFRPSLSHPFTMAFEPSGSAPCDLFAPSPKFFQNKKAELWQDFRSKSEESAFFDSFPKSFMNHTKREVREMTRELQTDYFDIQPFFHFQEGHSAEPAQFSKEQNLFEPARNVFAPLLPTRFHPHSQSSHCQPFEQFSARPTFRSYQTDMRLYPPSHMLERSLTPPPSSLLSPEHWSFPPMRLY